MTSSEWRHLVIHVAAQPTPLQYEGSPPPPPEEEDVEPVPPELIKFNPLATLLEQIAEDERFVSIAKADIPELSSETYRAKIEEVILEQVEKRKAPEPEPAEDGAEGEGGEGEVPADGDALAENEAKPNTPPQPSLESTPEAPPGIIDGIILLHGFEEDLPQWLQEADQLPLHAVLYLDGTTIEDVEIEEGVKERQSRTLGPPEVINALKDILPTLPNKHWGRNVRVSECLPEAETMVPPPTPPEEEGKPPAETEGEVPIGSAKEGSQAEEDVPKGPALLENIWNFIENYATEWYDFDEWKNRINKREVNRYEGKISTAWYKTLMDSAPSYTYDVNTFLYCMVEQVERNLEQIGEEEDTAVASLDAYFQEAQLNACVENPQDDDRQNDDGDSGMHEEDLRRLDNGACVEAESRAPVICCTDKISQKHYGRRLFGGISQVEVCKQVVEHTRCTGYPSRLNFPKPLTEQEMSAERHRIYPFMIDLTPIEIERAMLLQALENMLTRIGSPGNVAARLYHEKIANKDLVQLLNSALESEPNMDIEYYPRHDLIMIVLHRPVLSEANAAGHLWCAPNSCEVSFNDIHGEKAGYIEQNKNTELLDLPCEEYAYPQVIEKVGVAKCSVWMQIKMCRGLDNKTQTFSRVFAKGLRLRLYKDERWDNLAQLFSTQFPDEIPILEHPVPEQEVDENGEPIGDPPEAPEMSEEEKQERIDGAAERTAAERARLLEVVPRAKICVEEDSVNYIFSLCDGTVRRKCLYGIQFDDCKIDELVPTVSFCLPNGQCVEALPNEQRLSIHWPTEILQKSLLQQTPGVQCAGKSPPHFQPGSSLDIEMERLILLDGTVVRRLLSGRREVFYSDGTSSFRNPTSEEIQASLDSLHRDVPEDYFGFLRNLVLTTLEYELGDDRVMQDGYPGHWIVTKLSGVKTGRMFSPPVEIPEEEPPAQEEGEEAPPPPEGEEEEGEKEEKTPPEPTIEEILEAYNPLRVGDGNYIEYTLKSCPINSQVDAWTAETSYVTATGLLVLDDCTGDKRICIHPDGTHVTYSIKEKKVIVEHKNGICVECKNVGGDKMKLRATFQNDVIVNLYSSPTQVRKDCSPVLCDIAGPRLRARMCDDGIVVLEGGIASDPTQTFIVNLMKQTMRLEDEDGVNSFILHSDQRLEIENNTKGGQDVLQTIVQEDAEPMIIKPETDTAMATMQVSPRIFLVHGNGEAEELVTLGLVEEVVKDAFDAGGTVLQDQPLGPPMQGCTAHTIFLPSSSQPSKLETIAPVTLPRSIRVKDTSNEKEDSRFNYVSFRQFIEYPKMYDDKYQRFLDGQNGYEKWLAEQKKLQDDLADKKKDDKKKKKNDDKKKKKGKKGGQEEVVEEVKEPALDPKFQMTKQQFQERVILFRGKEEGRWSADQAFDHACDKWGPDACATRVQKVVRGVQDRQKVEKKKEVIAQEILDAEKAIIEAKEKEEEEKRKAAEKEAELEAIKNGTALPNDLPMEEYLRSKAAHPTFKYFESQLGIQFLMEIGKLEKIPAYSPPPLSPKLEVTDQLWAAWNPRMVYDPDPLSPTHEEPEIEYVHEPHLQQHAGMVQNENTEHPGMEKELEKEKPEPPPAMETIPMIPPEPFPVKREDWFNSFGNLSPPKKPKNQDFVTNNLRFLEIEGPVDRRVRTCSIIHKKNSCYAPSVQNVRKHGSHVLHGSLSGINRATGVCPDANFPKGEELWNLSSTQQGLGNSSLLVEVAPHIARFGPLRCGNVYTMSFRLRNCDVANTRFVAKITPPDDQIGTKYVPIILAPGMPTKIHVEVYAKKPGKFEKILEIKTKAHITKIPIIGRIIEQGEYDNLDSESVALHARHIGNIGRGVNIINDENYCIKKLGDLYDPALQGVMSLNSQDDSRDNF